MHLCDMAMMWKRFQLFYASSLKNHTLHLFVFVTGQSAFNFVDSNSKMRTKNVRLLIAQNIHGDDSNIKFVWICWCFFFHRCLLYERMHAHISNWIIPYRDTWKKHRNFSILLYNSFFFFASLLLITWRAWNIAAMFQMYGWREARIWKEYERWKLNNKSFEWWARKKNVVPLF